MPARLAFPFIYRRLTDGMSDDARLGIDAALGDTAAAALLAERKIERNNNAVVMSGFEVG